MVQVITRSLRYMAHALPPPHVHVLYVREAPCSHVRCHANGHVEHDSVVPLSSPRPNSAAMTKQMVVTVSGRCLRACACVAERMNP